MPLDPQNSAQIRDRELRLLDLLLKGIERLEIARRERVRPSVMSRIKTRVERATRTAPIGCTGPGRLPRCYPYRSKHSARGTVDGDRCRPPSSNRPERR
jgi:hypothetical protein